MNPVEQCWVDSLMKGSTHSLVTKSRGYQGTFFTVSSQSTNGRGKSLNEVRVKTPGDFPCKYGSGFC